MGGGAGEGNVFQLCCVYLYFCGKLALEEALPIVSCLFGQKAAQLEKRSAV